MAADPRDPRDPRDPVEQLRADRDRLRAEERADDDGTRDWRHDTLEMDPVVPVVPVVDGQVLRARTRNPPGNLLRNLPRRVPAAVVVGVLLLAGAGAVSAVAGAGAGAGTGSTTSAATPSTTPPAPGVIVVVGDQPEEAAPQADGPAAGPAGPPRPPAPPGRVRPVAERP